MAEGKNTVVIYKDWGYVFEKLTDEEAGKLAKHLFAYINDKDPKSDRLIELIFEPFRQTLKRDLKQWEKEVENKKMGGRIGNLKRWNNDLYLAVVSETISIDEAESIAKERLLSDPDKNNRSWSHTDKNNRSWSDKVASVADSDSDSDIVSDSENNIKYIVELWNTTCSPPLSEVTKISESRRKKIKTRLKIIGVEKIQPLFEKISQTKFLLGDNPRGWMASFDWVFENDKNWLKIMEGNYDGTNKFNTKQSTSRDAKKMVSYEEKNYEAPFFQR